MFVRSVSRDSKSFEHTRALAQVRYQSEGIGKRLRIFLLEMTRASNSTYFAPIETASSSSVSFHLASNRPRMSQVNACEARYLLSPISYLLHLHCWIQNTSDTARIEVKHLFLEPLPFNARPTSSPRLIFSSLFRNFFLLPRFILQDLRSSRAKRINPDPRITISWLFYNYHHSWTSKENFFSFFKGNDWIESIARFRREINEVSPRRKSGRQRFILMDKGKLILSFIFSNFTERVVISSKGGKEKRRRRRKPLGKQL